MFFICLLISVVAFCPKAEGALAGGRPNSFSAGINAFAGISNPANAVWIPDRWDVGLYWIYQTSNINNLDNNPFFLPGKTNTAYKNNNLLSYDAAITKQIKFTMGLKPCEGSLGFALYAAPNPLEVRTKDPVPLSGTTPQVVKKHTRVFSTIFSLKLGKSHSIGFSCDCFFLSHYRGGFQNADTPLRSVSPGNVTNNGTDHSWGPGISLGWRWKITPSLDFGLAWIKKSYVGQFGKYRGFEPDHARNYIPQSIGTGFGYRFTSKISSRCELLWINFGDLPGANSAILPDGQLNTNKRGSGKSPGPGLQDATLINLGLGYQFCHEFNMGIGFSHRLKFLDKNSNILSHTYRFQTIYDLLTLGSNFKYKKHDFFLIFTRGFKNKVEGFMPSEIGGGRFSTEKANYAFSFSWGYLY